MIIRFKGITHERTEDAPFVGALISAITCSLNCKGCFNQHLKKEEILYATDVDIIEMVKSNPLNKGIILGGLEWTEQPDELRQLVKRAVQNGLQVMIYSGLDEKEFIDQFSDLWDENIYIKTGRYSQELVTVENKQCGVRLATSNQKIKTNDKSI